MARRDDVAGRMAEAVVRRLVVRRLADVKDESEARAVVRRIVVDNLNLEEKIDYRRLFTLVKGKLARERGFTL
jgi:hypothetical protein